MLIISHYFPQFLMVPLRGNKNYETNAEILRMKFICNAPLRIKNSRIWTSPRVEVPRKDLRMPTLKAAKKSYPIVLVAIFLMLVSGLAQAGEKTGYLGVILQDINKGMAKAMNLDNDDGVLISEVVDGSPADEAGLKDGDVIIKFMGKDIENHAALTKAVGSSSAGEEAKVVVLRDGKKKTIKVELGKRKSSDVTFFRKDGNTSHEQIKIMIEGMDSLHEERGFMGIEVDDINEQMGKYFDVKDGEGALISSVTEDSAADEAGLEAGDVIVKIGDEDIESAGDVHAALAGTEPEQKLEIKIIRKGKKKTLDITLGEVPDSQAFKFIEMIGGDNHMAVTGSNKRFHGMPNTPRTPGNVHIIIDDEDDLKEMRDELEEMKRELEEMKAELKNK